MRDRCDYRTSMRPTGLLAVLLAFTFIAAGCATYRTPGGPASFRSMGITIEEQEALTDEEVAALLDRKPLAGFPASIAVVRVQDAGYRSYTARGYGHGRYTVVTNRDVESEESFRRLADLPMIRTMAPLNRLVLTDRYENERDLRHGAANVQADMLLVYTFDTQFELDSKIPPLKAITLGLFPESEARVVSTVSAALIDTRNGYVYGVLEATDRQQRLANAWVSEAVVDETRRTAEQLAFEKLVDEFITYWPSVVSAYGPGSAVPTDDAAGDVTDTPPTASTPVG